MTQNIKKKTVAFTGHRQLKPAEPDLFSASQLNVENTDNFTSQLRQELQTTLNELYSEGYVIFMSGMAMGFDLMAADEVLNLKSRHEEVQLIAVVPHPEQSAKYDCDSRRLYDSLMQRATETILTSEKYSFDCYHKRNDYLIANSSVLIAFYNGEKGGTEYTVKQALRNGLRIINLPQY